MANLVDTIQAEGTFTTFTRSLKESELAVTLREPGAYTVFAPTDAAFAQMHADMLEDLFEDRDDLSKVVRVLSSVNMSIFPQPPISPTLADTQH